MYVWGHRPATDPDLPPAQACLVNFERYKPLVEALRAGSGPAKHLDRWVGGWSIGGFVLKRSPFLILILNDYQMIRRVAHEIRRRLVAFTGGGDDDDDDGGEGEREKGTRRPGGAGAAIPPPVLAAAAAAAAGAAATGVEGHYAPIGAGVARWLCVGHRPEA